MINLHIVETLYVTIFITISLSILDITLTIKTVKLLKELKPHINPHDMELNPLPRWLWEKFGYNKAKIIQYVMNSIIIFLTLTYSFIYAEQMFFYLSGFLIGSLLIVNIIHQANLDNIKKELKYKVSK